MQTEFIPCACGCGTAIAAIDKYGTPAENMHDMIAKGRDQWSRRA